MREMLIYQSSTETKHVDSKEEKDEIEKRRKNVNLQSIDG